MVEMPTPHPSQPEKGEGGGDENALLSLPPVAPALVTPLKGWVCIGAINDSNERAKLHRTGIGNCPMGLEVRRWHRQGIMAVMPSIIHPYKNAHLFLSRWQGCHFQTALFQEKVENSRFGEHRIDNGSRTTAELLQHDVIWKLPPKHSHLEAKVKKISLSGSTLKVLQEILQVVRCGRWFLPEGCVCAVWALNLFCRRSKPKVHRTVSTREFGILCCCPYCF